MLDSRRRKILRDMGIDVWVLRAVPGQAAGASSAPAIAELPTGSLAAATPPNPAAAARAALTGIAAQQAEPRRSDGSRRRAETPDSAPAERIVVESVALKGVVLLLYGPVSRRDQRLAHDVVSSAVAAWSEKPVHRRFSWPPAAPAGKSAADANGLPVLRRALRAFVDKDLHDHQAHKVLYVGAVAEHLPDTWPGARVLRLPALGELSRDAEAKKRLWTEMCASGE